MNQTIETKTESYAEWIKNLREGAYRIRYRRYKDEPNAQEFTVWVEKRPCVELTGEQLLFVFVECEAYRPESFKNRVDFQAEFLATPEQDKETRQVLVSRFTADELHRVLTYFGFTGGAPHKLARLQHKAKCATSRVHPI